MKLIAVGDTAPDFTIQDDREDYQTIIWLCWQENITFLASAGLDTSLHRSNAFPGEQLAGVC